MSSIYTLSQTVIFAGENFLEHRPIFQENFSHINTAETTTVSTDTKDLKTFSELETLTANIPENSLDDIFSILDQDTDLDLENLSKEKYQEMQEKYDNTDKTSPYNWRNITVEIAKDMGYDISDSGDAILMAFGENFQKAIAHTDEKYENHGVDGKIGPLTLSTFLNMTIPEKKRLAVLMTSMKNLA